MTCATHCEALFDLKPAVGGVGRGTAQAAELLTPAEERQLAGRVREGDSEARDRLIRCNLRLVMRIARQFEGRGLGLDDLIGEGNLGLIRAAGKYDPKFGTRFSTYACYWIKEAIRAALINTAAPIRLPAHMVGLLTRWRRAERVLSRELGRAPAADHVASVLRLSPAQREMAERALRASRMRVGQGDGEEGWRPEDAAEAHVAPFEAVESEEARDDLRHRLGRLGDLERSVITLRFGLGGSDPMTRVEVGRRLGVTREWVRKVELRAVERLR
jgi:RNA polymerase primary sigma factor